MKTLEEEKLYGHLKKCSFFTQEVTLLGHIVTAQGVKVDENKVEAIRLWLTPSTFMMCEASIDLSPSISSS